ncbi:MFS transporter [Bacillus pseudomycoides]|uniref:MFS transporter n=3 Tax=Bacillus pseudomycoides TaxID=64104 RepID=A0A2B5KU82_9BACI|nr:MFS transporter [Bacillus pseudomycoides]PDY44546.1 MFS transporter [Bacillus pseudomycoides]PEA81274.1 MFS transporter [Bacillus pseudomycoides]PED73883.1 MFS transporter [Bacillus pseudomycoides]PEI42660.1 MFS transporter [Bacillus pseudomycoides]PEI95424.1 MFS transporter [Bacillus pseudomycoides]
MVKRLLWLSFFSYMLIAFTLVIIGAMLPEILNHYKQNYSNGGLLIFAQFVGFLLGVISMPILVSKLGRKNVVVLGLIMICFEFFTFFLPNWYFLFPLVGLAGYGAGVAESCIGTIILVTFQEKQANAMSKLEVAFGLGALFMPLFSSVLISKGIWEYAFLLLGLSSFLVLLGWRLLSFGKIDEFLIKNTDTNAAINKEHNSYTKKTFLIITLSAIYFFCYGGSEVSIVHFLPSIFMEEWEVPNSLATLTVTIYWSAMVIGRALTGIIAERLTYNMFLLLINIGGLIVLILLAISGNVWFGFFLCFFLGLFMAAMFAIALIITNLYFPGQTEKTTSILLATNGLGGSLIPIIIGQSMDKYPAQVTFWLFACIMLIMLILIIGIQLLGNTRLSVIREHDNNHKF